MVGSGSVGGSITKNREAIKTATMNKDFKPEGYTSLSPYFIIDNAIGFVDFLIEVFGGKELRIYKTPDGKIMHAEVQVDDSVIMLGNSSEQYPAITLLLHFYHPDVDALFNKAIEYGCVSVEPPKQREGDPDRRGTFKDAWGNTWSIGTQL
jgi:PhnB protein